MHTTTLPLAAGAPATFPPMPRLWLRTSSRRSSRRPYRHNELPGTATAKAQTLRGRVGDAFRRDAHAVEPSVAHARTMRFYQSSGHAWSRVLAGRPGSGFGALVAKAFRELGKGVDSLTAQARTLGFYGGRVRG